MYWYCDYLLECQYRQGRLLHAAAPAPPPPPRRGAGGRGGKQRSGRGGGASPSSGQMSAGEQVVAAREVEVRCGLRRLPPTALLVFPSTAPTFLCSLNQLSASLAGRAPCQSRHSSSPL